MMRTDDELKSILTNFLTLRKSTDIFESEIFELKEAKSGFSYDRLFEYFSALSNEANLSGMSSAWLVLGVSDSGAYVGTEFISGKGDIPECKKRVGDKTNDRISFIGIYELEMEGKRVLMFEIPPAVPGVPTTVDGHPYGRDGASVIALSEEKRQRILSQPRFFDWSREIVSDATIDDLDTVALLCAKKHYVTKNQRLADEVPLWSDERFLKEVPLAINGKITRAALVLLGKRESRHLLYPADVSIRWILKDEKGEVLDYYIGDGPFILEVEEIYRRIRNLKYRYIPEGTLFPTEVDMYDEYLIREPLNNAIAHQDYSECVRISVVEMPDRLIFYNAGSFIPGSVETVLSADVPDARYRNQFLVTAMRQLDLIDTVWSGIRKMFRLQKDKFFPMPEYEFVENGVRVTIYGKILNQDFAKILSANGDLTLTEVLLLDKVSRGQKISKDAVAVLRKKKLIEGRYPNLYLSLSVADKTNQRAQYTVNRGLDKESYRKFILVGIKQHGSLSRKDIDDILWEKLPASYNTEEKKRRKISNLLSEMRKEGLISSAHRGRGSMWVCGKK
ncbi:MAG: ATP-binding protein [Methanocorpusculum sp.]|nr:ATP-binding protein [Methanocorpusculum sp.]